MVTNDRDDEFLAAFESCTIANDAFHHADHVRLAWVYLQRFPVLPAIERFTTSLKRFAAHHGAPGLYHETITWAYLLLIHERMNGESSFDEFRDANPDLFRWKPSILHSYYQPETLQSDRAKQVFLLPDRAMSA